MKVHMEQLEALQSRQELEVAELRRQFLIERGWVSHSSSPGAYWLWEKDIEWWWGRAVTQGKVSRRVLVTADMAVTMEQNAYPETAWADWDSGEV